MLSFPLITFLSVPFSPSYAPLSTHTQHVQGTFTTEPMPLIQASLHPCHWSLLSHHYHLINWHTPHLSLLTVESRMLVTVFWKYVLEDVTESGCVTARSEGENLGRLGRVVPRKVHDGASQVGFVGQRKVGTSCLLLLTFTTSNPHISYKIVCWVWNLL